VSGVRKPWPGDDDDASAPADIAAWRAKGFTTEQAREFQRWRFSLAEAVAWQRAGVSDGLWAAQWATAGVTPQLVTEWRAAGIAPSEAVHWHEMGFGLQAAREARLKGLTPEDAFRQRPAALPFGMAGPQGRHGDLMRRLREAGAPGHLVHGYLTRNWSAEDALPWARAGIDAADAELWRAIGLTAAEAGRLTSKGAGPVGTVRDWWRAGIPFDEAADWIGAGLSPEEASAQRARGITVEQAATLRALRDQDAAD
jgi:hypothetical protein